MDTAAHTVPVTDPDPAAPAPLRSVERRGVPAMGTTADVVVVTADGDADLAERLVVGALERLADLESRWTRFSPDSEVSRINAGDPDAAGPDTRLLLERAAEGHLVTAGRFDPYRLADVVAAGYARSRAAHPTAAARPVTDAAAPTAGFDPGGIGKGLAADLVTEELLSAGAVGALVSLGGDLRVRGTSPDGGSWQIDIEDPRTGGTVATVRLDEGAVATSSQVKRRWTTDDGHERHHLIDPETGTSAATSVLSATVIAAEAWQAEVLTKVAFLDAFGHGALSDDAGLELIESLQAAALVVTPDLELTTSRWERFAVDPAAPTEEVVR